MIRSEIENEIKFLISSSKDEITYINPLLFHYLEYNQLLDIRNILLNKKENVKKDNKDFLDELYQKIK